ncbi:MAG: hypothetical protein JXA33_28035 [Anaerolineae bacterium]|nr:hypothetical protein [Anaerolineae bacterium]
MLRKPMQIPMLIVLCLTLALACRWGMTTSPSIETPTIEPPAATQPVAATPTPVISQFTYSGVYATAMPPDNYGYVAHLPKGHLFSLLPSGGLGEEIRDLVIDVYGHLWVATQIGLGCWDGENWLTYNTADSPLPHDDVRALAIAPDGYTLWVGTAGGLAKLDDTTWTLYPQNLASPVIADLDFAPDGRLWVATSFGGVSVYDGTTWEQYDKYNSGLLGLSVSVITAGADGRIWMVDDFGDGVSMFDGQTWTHYTTENSGLFEHRIEQILVDQGGRVWFVSPDTLSVLDGEIWNPVNFMELDLDAFHPWRIAQTAEGDVWVAGIQYYAPLVYHFTLQGAEIGNLQEYEIPALHQVEDVSFLPAGRIFSDTTTPTVTQWLFANPQVLLPTTDGTWLGTSFGLYKLDITGTVSQMALPNAQPPEVPFINNANNPFMDFVQLYEFHPTHVRVLAVGTVEVQQAYDEGITPLCEKQGGPDLYNPHDVTEFMISENITLCYAAGFESYFRPIDLPAVGERYTYWMHEIIDRLPHLHTPDLIMPEQFYHFGLRSGQPGEGMHWQKILAFPLSTEILEVHGTPPTAEVILNDWRLFIYDVRYTDRPHVNFILHNDAPTPSLENYLEAAGWQVGE